MGRDSGPMPKNLTLNAFFKIHERVAFDFLDASFINAKLVFGVICFPSIYLAVGLFHRFFSCFFGGGVTITF